MVNYLCTRNINHQIIQQFFMQFCKIDVTNCHIQKGDHKSDYLPFIKIIQELQQLTNLILKQSFESLQLQTEIIINCAFKKKKWDSFMKKEKPTKKEHNARKNFVMGKTRQQSKSIQYNFKPKVITPLNVKKNKKQEVPKQNPQKNRALLQMIDQSYSIQGKSFQELKSRLQNLSSHLFSYSYVKPAPLNEQGKNILKNGNFLILWLRILKLSPYFNHQVITAQIYNQFKDQITSNSQQFSKYCKQIITTTNTPTKQTTHKNTHSSLKRSILKNSQKKVQFKADQIIYPPLQPYPHSNPRLAEEQKVENRKSQIRKNHQYLLDYFEINDIFLLRQVEFVGIIKQIDKKYAIIAVKYKGKQILCISLFDEQMEGSHNPRILSEIQKSYQNLCFLDLQGKNTNSLFFNSLSEDVSI